MKVHCQNKKDYNCCWNQRRTSGEKLWAVHLPTFLQSGAITEAFGKSVIVSKQLVWSDWYSGQAPTISVYVSHYQSCVHGYWRRCMQNPTFAIFLYLLPTCSHLTCSLLTFPYSLWTRIRLFLYGRIRDVTAVWAWASTMAIGARCPMLREILLVLQQKNWHTAKEQTSPLELLTNNCRTVPSLIGFV